MTLLSDVLAARDLFDPAEVVVRHPWFLQDKLDCIVSTDGDGLLCGLLLSHIQRWRIRGFYDGKALVVERGVNPSDCVFADVEIFRSNVRSFGNHMLLHNANRKPAQWDDRFRQCLAINEWRGHDRRLFRRKYPLASIHFLLLILAERHKLELPPSAAGPLLFADGVYKLLLQYTENAWDWLRYLRIAEPDKATPVL